MAVIEFWRDVVVGSPNDTITRYFYDTDDDSVTSDTFSTFSGTLGPIHPPVGTLMYSTFVGLDRVEYFSIGSSSGLNKVTTPDDPGACTVQAADFQVVRVNNTNLLTPNGSITITSSTEDVNDYEASIDNGANWINQSGGAFVFGSLPAGNYSIIIRLIAGVCSVTVSSTVSDQISYPPLIIQEETLPDLYSPIFWPIEISYLLANNNAVVKQDGGGTYLEVGTQDGKDYLATLPIIKIISNEDYEGTYQIESVDDPDAPTKFYFNGTYTMEQAILFVPFDRQVFQLFCEVAFNNYQKIADITVYPDSSGEYKVRLEGFLQGAFKVLPPVNDGDEITLLRKYYVVPRDFDMEDSPSILNAVYSAVEDLTSFLDDLVPLGPAPINFINELTQRGLPVLFSYIDTDTGRIKNVTSSNQTNVVSTSDMVILFGLPLNIYDFQWTNPLGVIADLQVDPALPSWITLLPSAGDTVKLSIDTGANTEGGDYDPDDYAEDDYLVSGVNTIVGCYEFEFSDGVTPLFTLRICVFPIQGSDALCASENSFNIAWINREGGWSSYVFSGRKIYGVDIGKVGTYKKGRELKRASVEEVYNTAEVFINNKSTRDLDFIASLRQSIQAFMWSEQTLQWSIPIMLDKQSFEKYARPFRQAEQEDSFKFRYAEEVVIQSQ